MATSHYFNNFSGAMNNQQRLMEDVIVESIKIMGHDCWYVPRDGFDPTDPIFGENPQSKFERAYHIEMYLANVEGFEGDGDYFSKFGLEIRDTSNFICSRRSFEKYVPAAVTIRPREGDLIYVPTLRRLFEIKFIEHQLMFYSLGNRSPYIYEMRAELFRFSQENINTGVEEIDSIEQTKGYAIELNLTTGSGNYYSQEIVYQGANANSSTASAYVKSWDPNSKVLQLYSIVGDFSTTGAIIGTESGASYTTVQVDTMGDYLDYDTYDNKPLQDQATTILTHNENNPFGNP